MLIFLIKQILMLILQNSFYVSLQQSFMSVSYRVKIEVTESIEAGMWTDCKIEKLMNRNLSGSSTEHQLFIINAN